MKTYRLAGLALTALSLAIAQGEAKEATHSAQPSGEDARAVVLLKDGWQFLASDEPKNGDLPKPDRQGWESISVPHTWNRVGTYEKGVGAGVNTPETINKYQGGRWYRLNFEGPASLRTRKLWLEFDAASRIAEIWLNGVRLGAHAGGFSRFRFDATTPFRAGSNNELLVRVDNSAPVAGSPTADVLPLSGDFLVRGGLYRPVRMIVTNDLHFDMLDHGGPGVYATTTVVGENSATVSIRAKIRNDRSKTGRGMLISRLVDAEGRTVAESRSNLRMGKAQNSEVMHDLAVPSPRLWQGTADPYLYRLISEITGADGKVLDRVEQGFGIRQIRLDPNAGFILNGKPLRLHGVGLHQDAEAPDWAMSDADIERTVDMIREMGANSIRLTHYQHGTKIHELADRYGLILWDEIPLVTQWTQGDATQPTAALVENAKQQLAEMMRQNFNHPSVAMWGIANEVDFGPNRPDFLGKPPAVIADPSALLQMLDAQVQRDDPSRPSVLASCCRGNPGAPEVAQFAQANAVNRYFGWYYGQPADLGPYLDGLRAQRPQQPLAVSEYGAGGALSIHTDNPLGGPVDMAGRFQPEEYQSWLHEQSWPILKARPWMYGTWLWNMFDFGSTVRKEGDSIDINTKGLVTYDRSVRKDGFYFYKANWSTSPTVHIAGRRYVNRAYRVVDVRVYSNAPETSLTLNGRNLGPRTDCPDHICIWPSVLLDEGRNAFAATGKFAAENVTDSIEWHLAAAQASSYRIDAGALVAAQSSPLFGSDSFFEGGKAGTVDSGGRGRAPFRPDIANARNRDLSATFREGRFTYRVPVAKGRYAVTLTFMEPTVDTGARRFDVVANGKAVLRSFDIAGNAGGKLKEITKSFMVDASADGVKIDFIPGTADAVVSAIEVTRQP